MGLLDRLFVKAAPVRPAADIPDSPIFIMAGQSVRLLSNAAVSTAESALKNSSQLFRITNFIASSVQAVPWRVEADPEVTAGERAPATTIKALNALLKTPNDIYTAQQMRYWMAQNLMLYGRAHFKVGVSSMGVPNGIYQLAAKYLRIKLDSKGNVTTYNYGMDYENPSDILPTRRAARPGQAYGAEISFPTLSGLVEYNRSSAAIESLQTPLTIIHFLMERAKDTAAGHPNVKYIITAEKTLTPDQRKALADRLADSASGGDDSGEAMVLNNTSITVHKLDNELADIHSKIPLDDMTRQIAGVFGVPIALLGLGSADAAKYASNYEQSRLSFWQDTILPSYLSPIAAGLTQAICPYGARVMFDLDVIPTLWQGRATLGETLSAVTFMTTNEKRKVLDLPPDDSLPELIPPAGIPPPSPDPSAPDDQATTADGTGNTPTLNGLLPEFGPAGKPNGKLQ
jgi:phage portal protein BeeE